MTKKETWAHIFRLIAPHKGRFLLAVVIALLSTGANLVEPLIYREAINDIAGLFVKESNDAVKTASGEELEEGEGPIESFLRREIDKEKLRFGLQRDNNRQPSVQTISPLETPPPVKTATPKKLPYKKKTHVKKPHSNSKVAERTIGEAANTFLWVVGFLFAVNVLSYILWIIGENMNVRLNSLIEQRFIQGAFAHVLRLPLEFFGKRAPSAIAKQIDQSEEVSGIMNAFSQKILPETLSLAGILTIMFSQNARLTCVAIAVIPIYLFIAWRSSNKLESGLSDYYERWEEVSGRITNALAGIKTVKLSGGEQREVLVYKQISDEAYKNFIQRSLMSNTFAFWQGVLTRLSTALVLGYGGYLTLVHKLTPGDVVMFVVYLERVYTPIDELTSLWVNLQQHIASISRAFRLLDNNNEEKRGTHLALTKGVIEVRDVFFGYTKERDVLQGVSFTFLPGTITGIVGGSGAGKTTTVDLLLKLYETDRGTITIDGQDLSGLDASSVRSHIGMVAADGAIFSGTLAENIRYKKPDAGIEEVKAAAQKAGLTGLITRLPEGLNSIVGQNGMGLSVGERQRIQIARVLVSRPKILVLDEATANLDYNTEAEVKKAVSDLKKECTIIIIAHRYSMIHDADYVYVLREGKIIEKGAPTDLVRQKGWFTGFAAAVEEPDKKDPLVGNNDIDGSDENSPQDEEEDGSAGEDA
jgi:ABC-type multidrug transport system fused ATPase/permease subunit